jgi:uncharacterized protein YxeA
MTKYIMIPEDELELLYAIKSGYGGSSGVSIGSNPYLEQMKVGLAEYMSGDSQLEKIASSYQMANYQTNGKKSKGKYDSKPKESTGYKTAKPSYSAKKAA